MGTHRWPCLLGVCFCLAAPVRSAIAAVDPDAGDEAAVAASRAVAAVVDPDCNIIGGIDACVSGQCFSGAFRYRGDVYRVDFRARLNEVKMQLAFSGTTDLTVAIHRQQADGTYRRYADDVVIHADGNGVLQYYRTGLIDPPVILEPGSNYAIGFAWGSTAVTYTRDAQPYPVPFEVGAVLGLVAAGLPPPPDPLVPETFPEFQIFPSGAYSMQLCFEPEVGACCSTVGNRCIEVLETECTGAGSFFHGERTLCAETPCIFGACCFGCGKCADGYTPGSCAIGNPQLGIGVQHWAGVTCPANEQDLCPPVTGACCRTNGSCVEVCELLCDGVYQGDGTSCSPNPCKGACCISGFDCSERTPTNCATFSPRFRGLGTTCATLTGANECGGACCFGNTALSSCQVVSQRAFCSYDSFPVTAYRGDGSTCPSPNCGVIDDYRACCLPDGTCINTTLDATGQQTCTAVGVNGELNDDPSLLCGELINGCIVKACCLPEGDCAVLTDHGCTSRGGSTPANAPSSCGLSTCTTGACCFSGDVVCTELTQAACTAAGGNYRGNGTTCAMPALVCPGIGACCRSNGDCFDDLTSTQCGTVGGDYEGDATVCDAPTIECDERGACCATTGLCLLLTQAQCDGIAGEFRAIGVPCGANTCPSGACCISGVCNIRTAPGCTAANGLYHGDDVPCAPDPCISGACCNNQTCTVETEADCVNGEGSFIGEGEPCAADRCLVGACCAANCTCQDQVMAWQCASPEKTFHAGATCLGETCSPRILQSDPPNCSMDPRQPHDPANASIRFGWRSVVLTFPCGADGLTIGDFTVTVEPSGLAPTITTAIVAQNTVTLTLDRTIDPGAWTCFTHESSTSQVCLGSLPADADANLESNSADVQALVDNLDGLPAAPLGLSRCDLDRSDRCTPADILSAVDLLNGADAFDGWSGRNLPVCPSAP